jgi:tripartite-type tricarboxylate transporter receptor subunit TctC
LQWLLVCLVAVAGTVHAQTYPDKNKPIRLIVPSGAASTADILARAYAKGIAEVAGLNVIVENKPGAETVIGVQALTSALPDGYTMMMSSSSTNTLNMVMLPNLPYDPFRDFLPLTGVSRASLVMNLGASTTFKSAHEFAASAKAHPGKYTCASATATTRLACDLMQYAAGIKLLNVPYKATAAAVTAVASGEADLIFVDAPTVRAYWQSGKVRPVAVTSASRVQGISNLPSLREEGLSNFELTAWYATYFPAKTPADVAATMRDILRRASQTKTVVDVLKTFTMEPLNLAGEELTALNRKEVDTYAKVLREIGGKPN